MLPYIAFSERGLHRSRETSGRFLITCIFKKGYVVIGVKDLHWHLTRYRYMDNSCLQWQGLADANATTSCLHKPLYRNQVFHSTCCNRQSWVRIEFVTSSCKINYKRNEKWNNITAALHMQLNGGRSLTSNFFKDNFACRHSGSLRHSLALASFIQFIPESSITWLSTQGRG